MQLLTFVIAALGFAYLPGPAMLYTAAQTLARGRRAGWLAVLGVHLGCYVHVVAATLGLAALFDAVPPAYVAMKIVGGSYLLWAGWRMWRVGIGTPEEASVVGRNARHALRDSVIVEVLNPKTALFFVAFLPLFVQADAALPVAWQLLWLGIATNFLFSSADVVVVLLAAPLRAWLRGRRGSRLVQRLGASLLAGLGVHGLLNASR